MGHCFQYLVQIQSRTDSLSYLYHGLRFMCPALFSLVEPSVLDGDGRLGSQGFQVTPIIFVKGIAIWMLYIDDTDDFFPKLDRHGQF